MVQQIASAITLAVAALNAASSMALPMGSQAGDMDILERDFDDIMDLEARDAHGWGEDLSARANDKPLAKPPVKSQANSAPNPLNLHPSSAEHGAPASAHASGTVSGHATGVTPAPHASGSVAPNGSKTAPGGPSKTVTKERTITLKPTPCGRGRGKGKGKGDHGHAGQPGGGKHSSSALSPSGSAKASQPTPSGHPKPSPAPVVKNGKNKRAATPKSMPHPKPSSAPSKSLAAPGASASSSHPSAAPSASGSGVNPKITPAPAASSAPSASAGGHTSMTTVTKKGKDGTMTVHKVTLVRPTSCAEPKGAPGHRHKNAGHHHRGGHRGGRKGHWSGQQGNGRGKPNNRRPGHGKGNKHKRPGSNGAKKPTGHGHGKREIVDENEFFGRSVFELDELD